MELKRSRDPVGLVSRTPRFYFFSTCLLLSSAVFALLFNTAAGARTVCLGVLLLIVSVFIAAAAASASSSASKADCFFQKFGGEYEDLEVIRRKLSGPGSYPPRCTSKCGKCTPCKPVHVPVPPGTRAPAEYYPEAWRCKCGNRLYMP